MKETLNDLSLMAGDVLIIIMGLGLSLVVLAILFTCIVRLLCIAFGVSDREKNKQP